MNWPKLVVEYGQAAAWIAILLALLVLIVAAKNRRHFLPQGPLGWSASLVALVVIYTSAGFLRWAVAKVDPLKPVFRQADRHAPDFAFQTIEDGSTHLLSEYTGKVVVLNIWATWCVPCRQEMPDLNHLQESYGKDGLVVITVSDETDSQIEKFPGYLQMHVVKGRVDSSVSSTGLYIQPEVARPVTHIIDREGVLRATLIGGQAFACFERRVQPYLKRPK
jgi:thiol-disulfide isomerase/thioredoxin